jgi:hypothetical protein
MRIYRKRAGSRSKYPEITIDNVLAAIVFTNEDAKYIVTACNFHEKFRASMTLASDTLKKDLTVQGARKASIILIDALSQYHAHVNKKPQE